MVQRPRYAPQRPQIGPRQVADQAIPPGDHCVIDMRPEQRTGVIRKATTGEQRLRLVRPEPRRSPARQDDAEDPGRAQRVFSIRTGTDLAAGTWLSRAWCATGISRLHSG